MNSALGIAVEILFEKHDQKDCSAKPDPQGNAQNQQKIYKCTRDQLIQATFKNV